MLDQDVLQNSHEAGVDIAESDIFIKSAFSFVTNFYECIGNGKDPEEALKHTMKDVKEIALRYSRTAFLKDMVQNSPNETIQSFDEDLEPAMHLGKIGTDYCKILIDYNSQKIDDDEFSCRFLHTSMKLLGTKAMVAVGQLAIPIPVIGAIIGNFVGGVMSKTLSENLRDALKEVKLARQNRIEIEKKCCESIRLLEMYRNQFKEIFKRYFHGNVKFFNESFDELERALYAGNADLVIGSNNKIQEGLG